jgi:hypothetical protein
MATARAGAKEKFNMKNRRHHGKKRDSPQDLHRARAEETEDPGDGRGNGCGEVGGEG